MSTSPANRPSISSRKARGSALAFVAIAAIAYVVWPRPAYEHYISPPLDANGTRAEFLIPRGWTAEHRDLVIDSHMEFLPPDRPGWWPAFLRRWFPPDDHRTNRLVIMAMPNNTASLLESQIPKSKSVIGPNGSTIYLSYQSWKLNNDTTVALYYERDSQSAMDSTRASIFRSCHIWSGSDSANNRPPPADGQW